MVTRLARSVTRSFKVESARAWTMVPDGGDTLTRCLYSVRNTGEQFFSYLKDAFATLYAEGKAGRSGMLGIGLH